MTDATAAWLSRGVGLLGICAAVVTMGLQGGGAVLGLDAQVGELNLEDGALHMPAGSYAGFGQGQRLELQLVMSDSRLSVLHGPLEQPWHFAQLGPRLGIYNAEGLTLSRQSERLWDDTPHTVGLHCRPPLHLMVDGRPSQMGEPEHPCQVGPLGVRAESDLVVQQAWLDGSPVVLQDEGFRARPAAATAGGLAVAALLTGLSCWSLLLLAPLVPAASSVGLPPLALALLLCGASAAWSVTTGEGWRRLSGAALALGLLVASGWAVVDGAREAGLSADNPDAALIARALSTTVSIDAFQQKVDVAVQTYGPKLEQRPEDKPLVVALGSSSTGGNTPGPFWPVVLQRELPHAHVQTLAWGGATTWHMRRILETLDLRPDVCVLYAGHNDLMPTLPGQSLASLAKGEPATHDRFVSAVPLPEARENILAIAERCGELLAMQEYSMEQRASMDSYAELLQDIPGVTWADGADLLAQRPSSLMMIDPIHPSFTGQKLLGEFVAERVGPWLTPSGAAPQ